MKQVVILFLVLSINSFAQDLSYPLGFKAHFVTDTFFYDSGIVKCIRYKYPIDFIKWKAFYQATQLMRVEYQYDECGYLRNIRKINVHKQNSGCWGVTVKYLIDDIEVASKCTKEWIKPFVIQQGL